MSSPDNIYIDLSELDALAESAIVGRTVRIRKPARVRIGAGSIIDDFTYISCGVHIGNYTHIGAGSSLIGGDAHIDIGHFVNLAPGSRLIAASNRFDGGGLSGPAIPSEYASDSIIDNITVGDHVLFGTGVVVLPGTELPEGLAAGAMTLLSPDISYEPWTVYVGNPARPIKARASAEILEAANRLKADRPNEFS